MRYNVHLLLIYLIYLLMRLFYIKILFLQFFLL